MQILVFFPTDIRDASQSSHTEVPKGALQTPLQRGLLKVPGVSLSSWGLWTYRRNFMMFTEGLFEAPWALVHRHIGRNAHFSLPCYRYGGHWEGQVPKQYFARNCMQCADLQIKIMFLTPYPMEVRVWWGAGSNINFFIGIVWNVQICAEKSCF